MADTKDFESLDDLFRKTFDNLPDTPSKSGWDTPSEQVWQHVQAQIKPPKSGWSTQTLTLLAAFAVVLTVGLYLFLSRPAASEAPAAPAPPTAMEQPVATVEEKVAETQPNVPKAIAPPAKTPNKKSPAPLMVEVLPVEENENEAAEAIPADSSAEKAAKPSDKRPPSPNTTERRKAELAQRAKEAWETPLQTLPQRWPGKSN